MSVRASARNSATSAGISPPPRAGRRGRWRCVRPRRRACRRARVEGGEPALDLLVGGHAGKAFRASGSCDCAGGVAGVIGEQKGEELHHAGRLLPLPWGKRPGRERACQAGGDSRLRQGRGGLAATPRVVGFTPPYGGWRSCPVQPAAAPASCGARRPQRQSSPHVAARALSSPPRSSSLSPMQSCCGR